MKNFYKLIAEFAKWNSIWADVEGDTDDFFTFLKTEHPDIWERLQMFYADDYSHLSEEESIHNYSPRLGLYGWDDVAEPGKFHLFLPAFQSIWLYLTDQEFGECFYCKKETELDNEHKIIVSWGFGPVVKYYDHHELDGSRFDETLCCRDCAIQMYKKLAEVVNQEQVTCVAISGKAAERHEEPS